MSTSTARFTLLTLQQLFEGAGLHHAQERAQQLPAGSSVEDLLERVDEQRRLDVAEASDKAEGEEAAIAAMTIYGAKGLQRKVVFVVGLEQGNFPDVEDGSKLYEQRRLCYVAMTRAGAGGIVSQLCEGPARAWLVRGGTRERTIVSNL